RYYQPEHGVFLSVDPDPGDADDPITQNGYTYAGNNPVMHVDPDGNWFWAVVNVVSAAVSGYQAYKSGGSWGDVAAAAVIGVINPVKVFTPVKQVAKSVKSASQGKHMVYALKDNGKTVYIGRTKNPKARSWAHKKLKGEHLDFVPIARNLTKKQAKGLEYYHYLRNGGKKKLLNKVRPISPKNKKFKSYVREGMKWRTNRNNYRR
ncbi:RHS repeat-associated core domain-containing protein, partial [Priestia taiwanensis]